MGEEAAVPDGKHLNSFDLEPCWRSRGQQAGDTDVGTALGHLLGRPLTETLLMSPACSRTATDAVA